MPRRSLRPPSQLGTPAADGQTAVRGRVALGGGALYLSCAGVGSPSLVLEAGYGNGTAIWELDILHPGLGRQMVQAGVAGFTRVCSYDRATAGDRPAAGRRGASVPVPRTARDVVADLHALLPAAGCAAPRVLVGHSLGGLFARLYASAYPDEVVGLVLVDAAHEEQDARLRGLVSAAQWAAVRLLAAQGPDIEQIDVAASCAQMRAAREATPLRAMPLVVLSHGRPPDPADYPPGWPLAAYERLWQELQHDLAGLVPGSRHVIAERSGHYIHQEQPELVIAAIRAVVAAVRDPGTWDSPAPAGPPRRPRHRRPGVAASTVGRSRTTAGQ